MIKIQILIPIFNDWESLEKLLEKIDIEISDIKAKFSILIVNDGSTMQRPNNFFNYNNINTVDVLNMKKNQGPNKSNATGMVHLSKNSDFDYLILMDGDGEDRPEELKPLIKKALDKKDVSIVCKRVKRSEGFIFTFLYNIHKIITLIFTGKNMNFGHYGCLTKKDALFLSSNKNLWCNFSATVKKFINPLDTVPCIRGPRYDGQSKVSLFNLIIHSFCIIAVFKYHVLFRSVLFFLILSSFLFFQKFLPLIIILQIILIIFTSIILLLSKRSNIDELNNSVSNIDEKVNIHTRKL